MTIGLSVSNTVTVAAAESRLPLTSVTLNCTVFAPTFEQLKLLLSRLLVLMPQASLLPLSMSAAVMFTFPLPSKYTVMSWVTTVGLMISSTPITTLALSVQPFASVTVT